MIIAPLLSVLLTLLAAWCTTGSRARRWLGVALGLSAMLPPWLLPPHPPLIRAVCALVAFTNVMRVVDLARMRWPFWRRGLHVISVVDSRRLVHRAPRLEWAALIALIGWVALFLVSVGVLLETRASGALYWVVRWSTGVVAVYAAVSALYRSLFVGYSALGFDTPPLHLAPIRSRSVQELWGERWARPISDWLGDTFFRPWARRRHPFIGLLLAFGVSAAFHAYGVWVGLGFSTGAAMAAWTLAYFVAQALVMTLERLLGVRGWPRVAGHAWTIFWMLALAPGFVEPLVRVIGAPGAPPSNETEARR